MEIIKYLSVYLVSMVKFFAGPVTGVSVGLTYMESVLLTIAGMMTTVLVFSFIGREFSKWWSRRQREKHKPVFSKKNRRIIKIWKNFGVVGVAFLTPILLTPIVGTVVAALFGAPRKQIFIHMLWSAVIWSALLNLMVFEFGDLASKYF
ncbi:small multi-drug export protein [Pontibacter burrus]|uniref:small multi-drug export protein n=1 Tax=Pontibacter burrus TaxID=2704466 RepID=UPI00293BCC24|nr:small multi-drug export protein [Pontibacter burrus]